MPDIISTDGWDTVNAIGFSTLNKAIKQQKKSPSGFDSTIKDDDLGDVIISGRFGDWQLTTGGDNKLLHMSLPIRTGNAKYTKKSQPLIVNLTDITAIIEVSLAWVATTKSQSGNFVLDTSKPVRVVEMDYNDANNNLTKSGEPNYFSPNLQRMYQDELEAWLKSNADKFQTIFATVLVNRVASENKDINNSFGWLKPTTADKITYAVVNNDAFEDVSTSTFGILSMTEGRTAPFTHQVSPDAIPASIKDKNGKVIAKPNCALLIDSNRVIENMFLPGIHLLFKDAKPEDFQLFNDGKGIQNTKDLTFQDQKLDNGHTVQPKIKTGKFSFIIEETELVMAFDDLYFEWSPGIEVHVTHTSYGTITLSPDRKHFSIVYLRSTTSADIQTSTGVLVGQIATSIGVAILAGALTGAIGAALQGAAATTEAVITQTARAATQVAADGESATFEATEMEVVETYSEGTASTFDGLEDLPNGSFGNFSASAQQTATTELIQAAQASSTEGAAGGAASAGTRAGVGETSEFAGFFVRHWAKLAMLAGIVVGAVGEGLIEYLKAAAKDQGKTIFKDLDQLTQKSIETVIWPNTDPDGYKLVSAQLNGALQLGIELTSIEGD